MTGRAHSTHVDLSWHLENEPYCTSEKFFEEGGFRAFWKAVLC
jgi:hypothetical protein